MGRGDSPRGGEEGSGGGGGGPPVPLSPRRGGVARSGGRGAAQRSLLAAKRARRGEAVAGPGATQQPSLEYGRDRSRFSRLAGSSRSWGTFSSGRCLPAVVAVAAETAPGGFGAAPGVGAAGTGVLPLLLQ